MQDQIQQKQPVSLQQPFEECQLISDYRCLKTAPFNQLSKECLTSQFSPQNERIAKDSTKLIQNTHNDTENSEIVDIIDKTQPINQRYIGNIGLEDSRKKIQSEQMPVSSPISGEFSASSQITITNNLAKGNESPHAKSESLQCSQRYQISESLKNINNQNSRQIQNIHRQVQISPEIQENHIKKQYALIQQRMIPRTVSYGTKGIQQKGTVGINQDDLQQYIQQNQQQTNIMDMNQIPITINTNMVITRDPTILREFDNIVKTDFKRFVNHRKCLNKSNLYLIYIFYFLQSAGILVTTLSVSLFQKQFVYIGVVLNTIASLIHIYGELNNKISVKLQKDIIAVLQNKYICEQVLIDSPMDNQQQIQSVQQKQQSAKEP